MGFGSPRGDTPRRAKAQGGGSIGNMRRPAGGRDGVRSERREAGPDDDGQSVYAADSSRCPARPRNPQRGAMTTLAPATTPTLYFFGVTTTKSSIMKVFLGV